MRTAIIYEKNRLMFKEIVEVDVYKDTILPRINISLSFNEKDEEHNIVGATFYIPYHKGSFLYNKKEENNISDEQVVSAVFEEITEYINRCVKEQKIINLYDARNIIGVNYYLYFKGAENEN